MIHCSYKRTIDIRLKKSEKSAINILGVKFPNEEFLCVSGIKDVSMFIVSFTIISKFMLVQSLLSLLTKAK